MRLCRPSGLSTVYNEFQHVHANAADSGLRVSIGTAPAEAAAGIRRPEEHAKGKGSEDQAEGEGRQCG